MLNELKIDGAQVVRLGKKYPYTANDRKPRPMKVVLDSEASKLKIVINAKNLNNKQEGRWEKSMSTRILLRGKEKHGSN